MLSAGFILSTNILDLCTAQDPDVAPVLPAYTNDDCTVWPKRFCTLEGLGKEFSNIFRVRGRTGTDITSKSDTSSQTDLDDVPKTPTPKPPERQNVTPYTNPNHPSHCCHYVTSPSEPASSTPHIQYFPYDRAPKNNQLRGNRRLRRSFSDQDLVRTAAHYDQDVAVSSGSTSRHWIAVVPGSCSASQPCVQNLQDCQVMGNLCSCCPCCPRDGGYDRVGDVDPDDERQALVRGKPCKRYDFEQKILDENVMPGGHITQAAIVSFKNGDVRATAPRGFNPDRKGIKNILRALKDIDKSGISDEGINLGSGSRVNTPGKLDEGKAIYGSDGKGGGCTIFKSKECVLIVFYDSDPGRATRLASEVAEYMEEQGH